jgi:peptidoglycan hydrolase-like protein with peptidoglycan-binding domain
MEIKLSLPFASNGKAGEFDTKQMKKALNRLGYYYPYEKTGITGVSDTGVFTALKAFQKDQGLSATGAAKPGDETIQKLNEAASQTPDGQYIWRTAEDTHVRKAHAEFNRTIRNWADTPDPGEDYNCRCWAEPLEKDYKEIYDPPLQPVYPELFLVPALKAKTALNLLELSASKILQSISRSRIRMDDTKTWPKPPSSGKLREGPPSRQKPRMREEKSLYDEKGGEWRYAKEDKYHNPHWDYKESPSSPWKNISINGKPILKNGR